eukprot:CAMPEP_0194261284 /NCGR_PEP_ID=MMETSP0158-20130606/45946_1 /TAXON_ID=33649 /ORGANISM="Thalassionema nitzschioides, Strain L26-B" /LENGTH=920 /DNA_ID=CAMNT_0039001401 /DNA_START=2058 /DNA_END=4820 /DNA_ORIENTATION=-
MKLSLALLLSIPIVVANAAAAAAADQVCQPGQEDCSASSPTNNNNNNNIPTNNNNNNELPPPLVVDENKEETSFRTLPPSPECRLYSAPSLLRVGPGVFTSVNIPVGTLLNTNDMILPVMDRFKTVPYRGQHRWMSWLDYVHGTTNYRIPKNIPLNEMKDESLRRGKDGTQVWYDFHRLDVVSPGLASEVNAHPTQHNIAFVETDYYEYNHAGLLRGQSPGVNAFASGHGIRFVTTKNVAAGSELFVKPTVEEMEEHWGGAENAKNVPKIDHTVEPRWLKKHAQCLDAIVVKDSTIPDAGRGAFAARSLKKGDLVAPSSLAVLKKEVLQMYEQENPNPQTFTQVLNKKSVVGTELIWNYCFGHKDSDILLLPLSPGVNYINHAAAGSNKNNNQQKQPNVRVQWPEDLRLPNEPYSNFLTTHPTELLDLSGQIRIEYVALDDIAAGEELVMDYGDEWQTAWENHVSGFEATKEVPLTATEYLEEKHESLDIKTLEEQQTDPYPSNLQTICHFIRKVKNNKEERKCWLPCDIEERVVVSSSSASSAGGETSYKVKFSSYNHKIDGYHMDGWQTCVTRRKETIFRDHLEPSEITIMDKWNSLDPLTNAGMAPFRHYIGAGAGAAATIFPQKWIDERAEYAITPFDHPQQLQPGEYRPITWSHNGLPVTRNAYIVGLPEGFNTNMYDFAVEQGAMEMFRSTLNGRPNKNGAVRYVDLRDGEWYVQRPHWNSNMHWVIPADETARQAYLRQLGKVGFDAVLKSFGTGQGLDKLTCFHNTLLGISQADDSNMHADFYETQRKSFDFLTPIIMSNNTFDPEFHLQSRDGNVIVNVKYQYGTAIVMGDWTMHKSAPVNYYAEERGDIRVVCSIYCSEITEENRDSLLKMYHEEAPAPFYHLFDTPVKEWHWDNDGMTLPQKQTVRDQF